jgi:hypothetical protein
MNVNSRGKRIGVLVAVAGFSMVLLAACGSNAGGSTACDTYNSESADRQVAVLTKMLKSRNDPTDSSEVNTARFSVSAYCLVHSGDSAIDGIYSG